MRDWGTVISQDQIKRTKYPFPTAPEDCFAASIETAEFNCLRNDGILFAQRLRQFGVPAELNNTEGAMYGFDIVLDSRTGGRRF